MGLILKWSEISEKIKHYREGVKNYIRARFEQLPSSLARDSRTRGALLGLRCPECQPTIQSSQSAKRRM